MKNEMKWLPIESAPKDGSSILVWSNDGCVSAKWVFYECLCGRPSCNRVKPGDGFFAPTDIVSSYDDIDIDGDPTHWMPLPPPPEA